MREKIKYYLSNIPTLYSIALKIHIFLKNLKNKILGSIFNLFPIKKNKIVICNHFGNGYGDNGKYIAEEIINQNLKYDIVWFLRKELIGKVYIPSYIRIVEYGSIKALYELSTSKVWIDNWRKTFYPPKRKDQYYIQTGHGGIPLKKIEKDAEDKLGINYINMAKKDSSLVDLMISNAAFKTKLLKQSYWYSGEVMECGSPKIEIIMNNNSNIKNKVFKHFDLDKSIKICLYAPTFRKSNTLNEYKLEYENIIRTLSNKYDGTWKVLVRMHPNIASKSNFIEYNSNIINASHYYDMQELLIASDILITDYSGIMFEYMHTGKPVFLFATDIEEYKEERGFYFDIYKLPFTLAKNNEELIININKFDKKVYDKSINDLMNLLGIINEFGASKKIVNRIKNIIGNI